LVCPFFILLGLYIPLLASYAWKKIRVPYIVAMPVLFGLEMGLIDWRARRDVPVVVFWSQGILLLLVVAVSLLAGIRAGRKPGDRKPLLEGPPLEWFAVAQILFLTSFTIVPDIFKALAAA
jgi:hypothetical protein